MSYAPDTRQVFIGHSVVAVLCLQGMMICRLLGIYEMNTIFRVSLFFQIYLNATRYVRKLKK
jgi:hypothetical protein